MVYTVTFNPAVDYIVHTKQLIAGATNRSDSEEIYFGGKGINVSIVLSELGIKSKALGFVAGFTGEAIENGVAEKGIDADFVHLNEGFSRINVKIKSGEETELNGQGPKITDEAIRELYAKLDEIQDGDTLVLAGSIPSSLPADIYERILERLSGKKIRAVVDATKDLLLNVLKYRPFLIKPNNFELGEIFGVEMKSTEDVVKYAGKLKEMGAQNVLVSMAGDGAVLLDENGKTHVCGVCRGKVKPAPAGTKTEQLVKRDMPADVFGAARKASVGTNPDGGVGAARDAAEALDTLQIAEGVGIGRHREGLLVRHDPLFAHGLSKTFDAADAATRAARHRAAAVLELPEAFGRNREVHLDAAAAGLAHLTGIEMRGVGNDALGKREAEREFFEHRGRGHHDGVRDAVVDKRNGNLLCHPVERRLVCIHAKDLDLAGPQTLDAAHGDGHAGPRLNGGRKRVFGLVQISASHVRLLCVSCQRRLVAEILILRLPCPQRRSDRRAQAPS